MDRSATRFELDGCSPGVGSEVIATREPINVTRMTDDDRGDHRTNAEDLGHGRARRANRELESSFRRAHLRVEVTEIIEMLTREVVTNLFDRVVRLDAVEEP